MLPILTYNSLDVAIDFIRNREKPLALYIFSNDKASIERVHSLVSFESENPVRRSREFRHGVIPRR